MSSALQGLAVVLLALAGTPEPKECGPEITYQFQVVEVRGLEWRQSAGCGLKPVASRGGVTVWTAPRDFFKALPGGSTKDVVTAPRITSFSQAPAHFTIRKNHPFVTQVSWRGEGTPPRQTTEIVREGMTTTIAGRCIDQGVLAQLVIEDTDIRSVHTLHVPAPAPHAARTASAETAKEPANLMIVTDVHTVPGDVGATGALSANHIVIDLDKPLSFKDVLNFCVQNGSTPVEASGARSRL